MLDSPQLHYLPYIGPEDFPEFVEMLGGAAFPTTYAAWDTFLTSREKEIWGAGNIPIFMGVNPSGFRQFVVSSARCANLNTLCAYVALLGSEVFVKKKNSERLQGEVVAFLGTLH